MGAPSLVGTDWLSEHLDDPQLRILDASWYLPGDGRDTRAEYDLEHIPGAAYFDIDAISNRRSSLPHMLPPPEAFAEAVQRLGIGNEHFVVIYDSKGVYSSPRVWWSFNAMGHENCAVLDGGLVKWKAENHPTTSQVPLHGPGSFHPVLKPGLICGSKAIRNNLSANTEQILDARSPSRFAGLEKEPRPGVKPGHIPGSHNVYYADLVRDDGTMRSPPELCAIFKRHKIDLGRPIVTTCGSGITAAIVFLAAKIAGANALALYDGSWAEWGAMVDVEIETGLRRE